MIRVLIMEDRDSVREGLALLIASQNDMRVVGESTNAEVGVESAAALHPDVVVMDLELPYMGGVEATRRIITAAPHTHVIGFTMHASSADRAELLAAGGAALVGKDEPPTILLDAIRNVNSTLGEKNARPR